MTRKEFLLSSAAFAAMGLSSVRAEEETPSRGILVRFLGSGAAGWQAEWAKTKPNMRRNSSILLENRVLIDYTRSVTDRLPKGCRPEVLFQTHSHGDHYDPKAAIRLGVRKVCVHESWAAGARQELSAAAQELGLPVPEVVALTFGVPVAEGGLVFTCVPSIHSTSRVTDGVLERTAMYLVEKGPARLLYATDTAGIPGDAARMIGIDQHVNDTSYPSRFAGNPFVHKPEAITALIMEATDGNLDDDFRMFVHSSVQSVARIASALKKTERYLPPEGQPVYLTHLGIRYRDWPSDRINAELPEGLRAAKDDLELRLG